MALTRADINRGYDDPRWGGFGYLGARERARKAAARSAADLAVLRLGNRRRWTYDDLFENVLNNRVGRIYGEWAVEQVRSDADLDEELRQGERELELTPGARSAFDFASNRGPTEFATRTDAKAWETYVEDVGARDSAAAERRFQLHRDVEAAAARDAAVRARAPFLYGRSRRRSWLTSRSGRARYRR